MARIVGAAAGPCRSGGHGPGRPACLAAAAGLCRSASAGLSRLRPAPSRADRSRRGIFARPGADDAYPARYKHTEARTLVIRLAESATDWADRETKPPSAAGAAATSPCAAPGASRFRSIWCRRLNLRLSESRARPARQRPAIGRERGMSGQKGDAALSRWQPAAGQRARCARSPAGGRGGRRSDRRERTERRSAGRRRGETLAEIAAAVGGARPLSVALGELDDFDSAAPAAPPALVSPSSGFGLRRPLRLAGPVAAGAGRLPADVAPWPWSMPTTGQPARRRPGRF